MLALVAMTVNGQKVKIDYKGEVFPYEFKIEKAEVKDGETVFFIKVKQKENFSYSILFDECLMTTDKTSGEIKGSLKTWNEEERVNDFPKPVNDIDYVQFTLSFPGDDIIRAEQFTLRIGTIQNRKKTPIILEGIKPKNKK